MFAYVVVCNTKWVWRKNVNSRHLKDIARRNTGVERSLETTNDTVLKRMHVRRYSIIKLCRHTLIHWGTPCITVSETLIPGIVAIKTSIWFYNSISSNSTQTWSRETKGRTEECIKLETNTNKTSRPEKGGWAPSWLIFFIERDYVILNCCGWNKQQYRSFHMHTSRISNLSSCNTTSRWLLLLSSSPWSRGLSPLSRSGYSDCCSTRRGWFFDDCLCLLALPAGGCTESSVCPTRSSHWCQQWVKRTGSNCELLETLRILSEGMSHFLNNLLHTLGTRVA